MTEKIDYTSWSEDSAEFLPKLRRVFQDINIRIASIEDTGRKLADIERRYGVVALERISDAITPAISEARELLTKVEADLAALDQAYRQDGQQRVDDIINPLIDQARKALEKTKTDLTALDQAYRQDGQRRVDEIINPLLTETKNTLAEAEAALTAINAIVSTMQPMASKGQPDGYAGLDAAGKVPAAQLPPQTNSTTVGAALAAPTPSTALADGDKFGGILSGGSKLTTWSWATIKATIKAFTDPLYATSMQGKKADNAVRYDAQTLTAQEQGQARANIDAGVLSGFRNKLINGNYRIAQRGTTFTVNPSAPAIFTADRWYVYNATNVPVNVEVIDDGVSDPALMFRFTSQPTTGTVTLFQKVEDVRTLPQGDATLTFDLYLEAGMRVFLYGEQNFGTGGSATKVVEISNVIEPASSNFVRKSVKFIVESIAGKTANQGDSNFNTCIQFHPRNIGSFGVQRASLVKGDATAEKDPFSPRHRQQELALCHRYYCRVSARYWAAYAGYMGHTVQLPVSMRTAPTTHLQNNSSTGIRVLRVENPQPLKIDLVAESDGNNQGCYFDALVYCNAEL